ncbi:MAG: homoserine O-succinyltransferase MetX [Steroidobacteraceae bacterium]
MSEPVLIAPEGRLHEEVAPIIGKRLRAPVLPSAEPMVREGVLEIPGELTLYHGTKLPGVRLGWRLVGPANAPVVCALGGISASRYVCLGDHERSGWWSEFAGPARPLDTHCYRILSFDYLGGSGETTGPRPGEPFPSISSYDQAELLVRLLNHLGIVALRAIAGGSYGGMVALAFGERYPERAGRLIVLCASDRPHPLATAWRSVQREIVRLTLASGRGADGLSLARALALSTYRSSEELAARFSGPPAPESDRFVFPIERYLLARGRDYAARHRPESFVCLSESIDLHRVDASRIFIPTIAVAVREDQLVPVADVRGMVARLGAGRLHEISSIYGHDAFLKESQQLRGVFAAALESN